MKKKLKIVFGIILSIVVLFGIIMVLINADVLFSNKVVVKYPDGCIEKFVENKLVSSVCVEGRKLESNPPNPFIGLVNGS